MKIMAEETKEEWLTKLAKELKKSKEEEFNLSKLISEEISGDWLEADDVKEFIKRRKQRTIDKIMEYVKQNLITPVVANTLIGELNRDREQDAGEKLIK